jgi:hypothetical protein
VAISYFVNSSSPFSSPNILHNLIAQDATLQVNIAEFNENAKLMVPISNHVSQVVILISHVKETILVT